MLNIHILHTMSQQQSRYNYKKAQIWALLKSGTQNLAIYDFFCTFRAPKHFEICNKTDDNIKFKV